MLAVLFLAFALPAVAQQPAAASPPPAAPPAASTETAPAAEAPAPPPPSKPVKRLLVLIHPDSGSWEPVSLTAGGDPEKIATRFIRLVRRRANKPAVVYAGEASRATATARVYPSGEDRLLIVSVHPKSLAAKRKFVEARFTVTEGYLEEATLAEVTAGPRAAADISQEDSESLSRKGISFAEDFASAGRIRLAAFSLKPGGLNAGAVALAEFSDRELKTTSYSWSAVVSRR